MSQGSSAIPSQADYERREAQEFQRQLRRAEEDSLPEHREACAEFLEAMREQPDLIAERLEWLFDGSYGFGAQQAARRVLTSRGNRVAWLVQTLAAIEWRCPQRMAADAWKKLSVEERVCLDQAVRQVMRRYADRSHLATPHGRCAKSRTCIEHAVNKAVPSCKKREKGRKVP